MSTEAPSLPAAQNPSRPRKKGPSNYANQLNREKRRQAGHQRYLEEKAALESISNTFIAEDFFGLKPYYSGPGESKYEVDGYRISIDKRKANQPFSSLTGAEFVNGRPGGYGPISLFRALCGITGLDPQPADMADNPKRYNSRDPQYNAYNRAHRFMLENFLPNMLPEETQRKLPAPKKVATRVDPSKMQKDIRQDEELPIALPGCNPKMDDRVRAYMVEKRGLPEKLVDTMIEQRVMYGSMREQELKKHDGTTFVKKIPTIVIPFRGVETKVVNAYSHIDLEGNFKGNRGQMGQAVFRIGKVNEDTREVVVTEAVIDALSKWSLDRPPRDTVIDAMAGSRLPEHHVQDAKKNGHGLVLAHDADLAGRSMARNLYNLCRQEEVPVRADMMEGAVLEVAVDHSALNWKERVNKLKGLNEANGIPFSVADNDDATRTSIFMPSTKETDPILTQIQETYRSVDRADDEALRTAYKSLHGLKYAPKRIQLIEDKVYMKDWNDKLLFQRNQEQSPDQPKHFNVPGLPAHFRPFPYPQGQQWGLSTPEVNQKQGSPDKGMEMDA